MCTGNNYNAYKKVKKLNWFAGISITFFSDGAQIND